MKNMNVNANGTNHASEMVQIKSESISEESGRMVYKELDDRPVQNQSELDILSENVHTLEALQLRIAFVMREINYLLNIKA